MLKVEFKQIENVVLMKVIEQGNEIELGHGCFFEYNGIRLSTVDDSTIKINPTTDEVQNIEEFQNQSRNKSP